MERVLMSIGEPLTTVGLRPGNPGKSVGGQLALQRPLADQKVRSVVRRIGHLPVKRVQIGFHPGTRPPAEDFYAFGTLDRGHATGAFIPYRLHSRSRCHAGSP